MGWNYIPDPTPPPPVIYPTNIYPPSPASPPPPGVSKSEWKEWMKFAKAVNNPGGKKKEEQKEHRGVKKVTNKNYNFAEVFLLLMVIGPFVGPAWNRLETFVLKLINGN